MERYGLIGYPLTHSFSKRFFSEKFEREKTNAVYENYETARISDIVKIINDNPELTGLNVTIPYKEQVLPYLNELSEEAREIGAVNTIKIYRYPEHIRLKGYNTDVYGFESSLRPYLLTMHRNALVLGTGGASKAVIQVLNKLGIGVVKISTRAENSDAIRYDEINRKLMESHLLIINTTPLGTWPNTQLCPDIPYKYITENHLLFDLVYNPEETMFMKKGKAQGAAVVNGYGMLIAQALKSYEIWTNKEQIVK